MNDNLTIRVSCYAGYRGEETPRRIEFDDRSIEVTAVLDRWTAPEHRYFKCRCADGGIYIVRHDVSADRWELTMFNGLGSDHLSST